MALTSAPVPVYGKDAFRYTGILELMARLRTEHGKRITLSVKVSEAKASAVERERGAVSVAAYLENLIDAALTPRTENDDSTERDCQGQELACLREQLQHQAAVIAGLEADLAEASGAPRCHCGKDLACPACYRSSDDWA
jgi:hypothetical protein